MLNRFVELGLLLPEREREKEVCYYGFKLSCASKKTLLLWSIYELYDCCWLPTMCESMSLMNCGKLPVKMIFLISSSILIPHFATKITFFALSRRSL
jgi:hypothetical protein